MQDKHFIIQVSDTHLFGDKQRKINGSNPYTNLKTVLSNISQLQDKPSLIVISGDLSQDCTFESYHHIANLLDHFGIKYFLFPGNHDDVLVLNKVFDYNWVKDAVDYSFELNNWFFYVIDTSSYPEDGGKLTQSQLVKLEKTLEQNKNRPTIIFMHHHPIEISSLWMDKMILAEKERFNKIINKNSQIKAVLFGHIHQVFERTIGGVFYASAPSTSFQVLPNCEMFTLEKLAPGYRLIELSKDTFFSKVIRLDYFCS